MTEQNSFETAITKRINELKQERGESTRRIAEATGISKSSVSRKLNGEHSWTTVELDSLARHWGFENGFGLVLGAKRYDESLHEAKEGVAGDPETPDTQDGVVLDYASAAETKRRTSQYQRNARGEIIRPDRAAAYEGDPRMREFIKDQDEPA